MIYTFIITSVSLGNKIYTDEVTSTFDIRIFIKVGNDLPNPFRTIIKIELKK